MDGSSNIEKVTTTKIIPYLPIPAFVRARGWIKIDLNNIISIYYPYYNSIDSIFHGLLNCLIRIHSFCAINLTSIISTILTVLSASFRLIVLSNSGSYHVGLMLCPTSGYSMAISSILSTKIGTIHPLFSHSAIFTFGKLTTSALLYQQDSTTTSELTPSPVSTA